MQCSKAKNGEKLLQGKKEMWTNEVDFSVRFEVFLDHNER